MPEYLRGDPIPTECFDVIVVGAGVVGCAMARRFALAGAKLLIIDRAGDPLDGASKGNSAILHTGFDAPPPGSEELACLQEGYREYREIHARLNLPLLECGAMVLAWSAGEAERLPQLLADARRNGVDSAQLIDADEVRRREPQVATSVVAALSIPGESLVDPWSAPYAYLLQALENGAHVALHCGITGGEFDGEVWRLQSPRGTLTARHVINCAGLYGDEVNRALVGASDFSIRPRKGQFLVYDKSARSLLDSILLPVPTEITKGIVVCPTVFGNILVGPTAEEQASRTEAAVDTPQLEALAERGRQILPGLEAHAVTATYAGLRPATEHKDYQVRWYDDRQYCAVGGIRSTGLSAALGIANRVFEQYEALGNRHSPPAEPTWPEVPAIAEVGERDWQRPGNNGIVCHCELVTRREIRNSLAGPLAPTSLAGLKRRTRVGMGRCQGFYCSGELCDLTEGCFDEPMAVSKS